MRSFPFMICPETGGAGQNAAWVTDVLQSLMASVMMHRPREWK